MLNNKNSQSFCQKKKELSIIYTKWNVNINFLKHNQLKKEKCFICQKKREGF